MPGLASRGFPLLPKWSFYILGHYSMAGPMGREGRRKSEHWERKDDRKAQGLSLLLPAEPE